MRRATYLHAIEHLPIPVPLPLPRLPPIPKLHQHHIPIHPPRHHHPKMANQLPRPLPHPPQKITRRHITRHRRNTKHRRIHPLHLPLLKLTFPPLPAPLNQLPQPPRLLPLPIQMHNPPPQLLFPPPQPHLLNPRPRPLALRPAPAPLYRSRALTHLYTRCPNAAEAPVARCFLYATPADCSVRCVARRWVSRYIRALRSAVYY